MFSRMFMLLFFLWLKADSDHTKNYKKIFKYNDNIQLVYSITIGWAIPFTSSLKDTVVIVYGLVHDEMSPLIFSGDLYGSYQRGFTQRECDGGHRAQSWPRTPADPSQHPCCGHCGTTGRSGTAGENCGDRKSHADTLWEWKASDHKHSTGNTSAVKKMKGHSLMLGNCCVRNCKITSAIKQLYSQCGVIIQWAHLLVSADHSLIYTMNISFLLSPRSYHIKFSLLWL